MAWIGFFTDRNFVSGAAFKKQIENCFKRLDSEAIKEVYKKYSSKNSKGNFTIPKSKKSEIRTALEELGAFLESSQDEDSQLNHLDKNQDGEIDFEEFAFAVQRPWPLEPWACSLPLAKLLVDCLPQRTRNTSQHLRKLDILTEAEIQEIAEGFAFGLKKILKQHNEDLSTSKYSETATDNQSSALALKFQANGPESSLGDLSDFHKGLPARFGEQT